MSAPKHVFKKQQNSPSRPGKPTEPFETIVMTNGGALSCPPETEDMVTSADVGGRRWILEQRADTRTRVFLLWKSLSITRH